MTGAGCWLTWRARSLMAARRSATSGVIGDQGELFGPVASVRAVWRALAEIAAGGTVTAGRVTAAVNAAGRGAWAGIAVRHGAQPPSPGRRCERIRLSLITLTLTLHPDALRAEVRDGSGILPVQRSAGREDDCGRGLAIIDALAEYWTPGRAPRGGKWVRACISGGNGLFDGGR